MTSRATRHPDYPYGAIDLAPSNHPQAHTAEWFATPAEAVEKARRLKSGVVMIAPEKLEELLSLTEVKG